MGRESDIKDIEARSWKGPQDHTTGFEGYSKKWDLFLLSNSCVLSNIKGKKVVNVGGGHGKEAEFILEHGAANVALIDIAWGQLESAKIRVIQKKIHHMDLFCGDAEKLPFKNKTFDVGIIFMALHHFPNHKMAVEEIIRISNDIIFIDILNCSLTQVLTKYGFFKKEWCGIEPNRIDIGSIQSIFTEKKMAFKIRYFFIPPYYGKNTFISYFLFRLSRSFSEIFLTNKKIAACFGNVAIIEGTR